MPNGIVIVRSTWTPTTVIINPANITINDDNLYGVVFVTGSALGDIIIDSDSLSSDVFTVELVPSLNDVDKGIAIRVTANPDNVVDSIEGDFDVVVTRGISEVRTGTFSVSVDLTGEPLTGVTFGIFVVGDYSDYISASRSIATSGMSITLTAANRPGYTFESWVVVTSPDGITVATTGNTFEMPESDVVVSATWTANVTMFDVTFVLNNGTQNCDTALTQRVASGEEASVPQVSRTGHRFTGWTANPVGISTSAITANVTFTAQWIALHTIVFDAAGGEFEDGTDRIEFIVENGSNLTAPADPTKDGNIFRGWSPVLALTNITAGATYTAQWEEGVISTFDVPSVSLGIADREIDLDVVVTMSKIGADGSKLDVTIKANAPAGTTIAIQILVSFRVSTNAVTPSSDGEGTLVTMPITVPVVFLEEGIGTFSGILSIQELTAFAQDYLGNDVTVLEILEMVGAEAGTHVAATTRSLGDVMGNGRTSAAAGVLARFLTVQDEADLAAKMIEEGFCVVAADITMTGGKLGLDDLIRLQQWLFGKFDAMTARF
jgi:hypothetical protein